LKLDDNNNNLFVLNSSNSIKILLGVHKSNFNGLIELTVSQQDPISDFKCAGSNKILILHSNNKISLYSFNSISSLLLDEKTLTDSSTNNDDYQCISLGLCPKLRYFACLLKGSGGRPDKIVNGEIVGD
jgi:hypothetical protein